MNEDARLSRIPYCFVFFFFSYISLLLLPSSLSHRFDHRKPSLDLTIHLVRCSFCLSCFSIFLSSVVYNLLFSPIFVFFLIIFKFLSISFSSLCVRSCPFLFVSFSSLHLFSVFLVFVTLFGSLYLFLFSCVYVFVLSLF